MKAIEDSCIVNASLNEQGQLIFTRRDGQTIYTGNVVGPKGDPGIPAQPSSIAVVGDTVPLRTSNGRIKAALAEQEDDVISRKYLEELAELTPLETHQWLTGENKASIIGDKVDLNTMTQAGVYFQNVSAYATVENNYPYPIAGMLEVFNNKTNMIWQRYTKYGVNDKDFYARAWYNGTWYPWTIVGNGSLPPPQYSVYNQTVDITASGSGHPMPNLQHIVISTSRDLWVDVRFKAFGRTNLNEIRANVVMTGATVVGWPFVSSSNILYVAGAISGSLTLMVSMNQIYKLSPGATTISVDAYKVGTHASPIAQFNYPVLEVIPLRWG
jgi:hypothetical protein